MMTCVPEEDIKGRGNPTVSMGCNYLSLPSKNYRGHHRLPVRTSSSWIILCMCPANERRRYIITSSLIGWAHTQNDPWLLGCRLSVCQFVSAPSRPRRFSAACCNGSRYIGCLYMCYTNIFGCINIIVIIIVIATVITVISIILICTI